MILERKNPDGTVDFLAYELLPDRSISERGVRFDTAEKAKDYLQQVMARHMERLERNFLAFKIMLSAGGWDHMSCDEYQISLLRNRVTAIYEDVYFMNEASQGLFDAEGSRGFDGMTTLHGRTAIAFAERYGLKVKYAELEGGNFAEGFPVELSPDEARQKKFTRKKWLWVVAPDGAVTDDLPEQRWPHQLEWNEEIDMSGDAVEVPVSETPEAGRLVDELLALSDSERSVVIAKVLQRKLNGGAGLTADGAAEAG